MKKKSSNFIAFDIGSSKIAALATHINKNGQVKINSQILQYSDGFKSGYITDMLKAENSIVDAIYTLEQECDKSIKEIAISLSGEGVKSFYVNHKIKLNNQLISKQDVKKLINKALAEFKIKDQEIIQYFPLEFIVNDSQIVDNPVGLYASELSCQLHIISAPSLMMMNLTKCLAKCHVSINEVFPAIYASGTACLTNDEKELGSIIIDIGSNITSFGIFLNGQIVYTGFVSSGGLDITREIARIFSVNLATADKIKILYGNANFKLVKEATIRLDELEPNNNSYNAELSISSTDLAKVIENKIREILLRVKEKCDQVAMNHLLTKRVIITGGSASLSGISSQVSEIFHKQVRIAKPEMLMGFSEDYNPYIYSTAIGIVKAKSLKIAQSSFKYGANDDNSLLKRTMIWLKENI